jgi:hypothetical protein
LRKASGLRRLLGRRARVEARGSTADRWAILIEMQMQMQMQVLHNQCSASFGRETVQDADAGRTDTTQQ